MCAELCYFDKTITEVLMEICYYIGLGLAVIILRLDGSNSMVGNSVFILLVGIS